TDDANEGGVQHPIDSRLSGHLAINPHAGSGLGHAWLVHAEILPECREGRLVGGTASFTIVVARDGNDLAWVMTVGSEKSIAVMGFLVRAVDDIAQVE